MSGDGKKQNPSVSADGKDRARAREERRAKALRENLRKRKAQIAERADPKAGKSAPKSPQ